MKRIKLIQFIAVVLLMLVTGLFWGTWFSMTRSIITFSDTEFIHIGKTIIKNVANPMRIIMPSCIIFILASLWFYPQKKSGGFYFNIIALMLILISLFITVGIEVPIDNQIKHWTDSTIPFEWETIRSRWAFYHSFRTFTSLGSFISFMVSILLTESKINN